MKSVCFVAVMLCIDTAVAQKPRWHLAGNNSIEWTIHKGEAPHTDQVEMSGKQVSLILTYGTDSLKRPAIIKKVVFPMLRTVPNNTHGSLIKDFAQPTAPILLNGKPVDEQVVSVSFNGIVTINSVAGALKISRQIFPSADKAAVIEWNTMINRGGQMLTLTVLAYNKTDTTDAAKSVYGPYVLSNKIEGSGTIELPPGTSYSYAVFSSGRKLSDQPYAFSAAYEKAKRGQMIGSINKNLVLHTPNDTLNQMFAFAKLRAAESIFDTKNGLLHGPGGGAYYAAIWANDQAEYVNPFFPFLGDAAGNESAINSFRLFAGYMNPEYKPIPSSIVAEGTDIWNGAGDRGDQAMIAYGASRFALAYADTAEARKLWPLINWCFNYLRKKQNQDGVIASDNDELEGRFPAGKYNLSTNVLAYGALVSASHLASSLGKTAAADSLKTEAVTLQKNIDKYFGARVEGFDTYRYFDGNTKLRSWIGLPLVMGMFERKDQTLKALYSPYLWTKDGMLTESGSKTYWDRSLLYAMRGSFYAGATNTTLKYLSYYSANRLLGEHVPYAIEAWPEGNQRHLSAESGLYCRLITEGLFGIEPTGFKSLTVKPVLPSGWNAMSLEHVQAFGADFTIQVQRTGKTAQIIIRQLNGKVKRYPFNNRDAVTVNL